MCDERFDFLPIFTLDNFHDRIIMPAFPISHLWHRKGKKHSIATVRMLLYSHQGLTFPCTQSEVSVTSGEGYDVSLLQEWNDPSYYSPLVSRLAQRTRCLHHRFVRPRSEFTVASRNLRGIIVLTRLRPRMPTRWFTSCRDALLSWPRITQQRARPASQRNPGSLACILSRAAHNSWGLDYFVWSARSTLSLGLIIASTHFGVCHSVRRGVTFDPFID